MTCEELKKQFYDYVLKEETKNGGVFKGVQRTGSSLKYF